MSEICKVSSFYCILYSILYVFYVYYILIHSMFIYSINLFNDLFMQSSINFEVNFSVIFKKSYNETALICQFGIANADLNWSSSPSLVS